MSKENHSKPDLLQTLKIISQLHIQCIGNNLGVLSIFVILLPVKEPVWNLELARIRNNCHKLVKLLG